MAQLNIDCEGPITKNDNAFELCAEFIPDGDRFFSIISKYDDYLADVEKRPDYQAGDTLKLILPFLKSYGVDHDRMMSFSASNLILLPRAKEMLAALTSTMPTFIISTSYKPYLEALSQATGFPVDQVYCTSLDMDSYAVPASEVRVLKKMAEEIAGMPMLVWDELADGQCKLLPGTSKNLTVLDRIFWQEITSMQAGAILNNTRIVGARAKAEAVLDSLQKTGNNLSQVLYIGDSITDTRAFDLVREGGGLAVSFNGNAYAINTAELCCMCQDMTGVFLLASLFEKGGKDFLLNLVSNWGLEALTSSGVSAELIQSYREGTADFPRLIIITDENRAKLRKESEDFRKGVRGVAVGTLG